MQNLVNLNPLDLTSKSAAPNKSPSSQSVAVQFQQMLSQEIAQKNPGASANNNGAANTNVNKANSALPPVKQVTTNKAPNNPKAETKSNNTQAADANKAAEKSANTDNTTTTVSANTGANGFTTSEKIGKKEDADKVDSKDDDTQQIAADQNGNAQLLALVANIGQLVADQSNAARAFAAKTDRFDADADSAATSAGDSNAGKDAQLISKIASDADKLIAAADAKLADVTQSSPEFANALKEIQAQAQQADTSTNRELSPTDTKPTKAESQDANTELMSNARDLENNTPSAKLVNDAKAIIQQAQTEIKNQTSAATTDTTSTPEIQGISSAMASTIQRAADVASTHLAPRVGSPAWDQAVGQKVVWMVAGGQQSAELTLNPPDLGPLQVVLSINNDQANASFTSAQPEVRAALESAMPKLRQMMDDAGISLTGFSVNSQASQGFAFQQNANSFAQQSSQSNQSGNRTNNQFVNPAAPVISGTTTIRGGSISGVDLFA
jgi:flagellar hook-length control protein FliK